MTIYSEISAALSNDSETLKHSNNDMSFPLTESGRLFRWAEQSGKSFLLGNSAAERGEVDGLLTLCLSDKSEMTVSNLLAGINKTLLMRSFVVGNCVTLADYALFFKLKSSALALSDSNKASMFSLMRWFRYMHPLCHSGESAGKKFGFPLALSDCLSTVAPCGYTGVGSSLAAASSPSEAKPLQSATPPVAPPLKKTKKDKKAKKEKKNTSKGQTQGKVIDFSCVEIKVGKVVECSKHDNSDKLLVEKIDLGESAPRTICSGLAKFISPEAMTGKLVLVVTNLKPAKMGGTPSQGMVLCAVSEDHSKVIVVDAPVGAVIGERIIVEGFDGDVASAGFMGKKKVLAKIKDDMRTNAQGECCYKGKLFTTSAGPCVAQGAPIDYFVQ